MTIYELKITNYEKNLTNIIVKIVSDNNGIIVNAKEKIVALFRSKKEREKAREEIMELGVN